jgi:hypothetical protein
VGSIIGTDAIISSPIIPRKSFIEPRLVVPLRQEQEKHRFAATFVHWVKEVIGRKRPVFTACSASLRSEIIT